MAAFDRKLSEVEEGYPGIAGIVVGAVVMRRRMREDGTLGREILVLRRVASDSFPLKWEVPGGGADFTWDGTLTDAAVRELYEEAGLVAREVVCPVGISPEHGQSPTATTSRRSDPRIFVFGDDEGNIWAIATFLVQVEGYEVKINPSEHCEYAWISEEEAVDSHFESSKNTRGRKLHFVSQQMRRTILEGFKIAAR